MDEMEVIARSGGVLIHDHRKAYYRYEGKMHGLCNAHHVRDGRRRRRGREAGAADDGFSSGDEQRGGREGRGTGRAGTREAEEEIPGNTWRSGKGISSAAAKSAGEKRRAPKSKTRNLIERLRDYEEDPLRFMTDKGTPFTNNQAERDLYMIKIHQKVSGCFRSWEGAYYFCRIKSYLSMSEKHDISSAEALKTLFEGQTPNFMLEN
jgi:transposase